MAAFYAISCSVDMGYPRIILEGDAANVLSPLKDPIVLPTWIIEDILLLLKNFFCFVFMVRMEANFASHNLCLLGFKL
jgi:hypothetical protein